MKKQDFEWSAFSLKLKSFYSKVGGYDPEYVILPLNGTIHKIYYDYPQKLLKLQIINFVISLL